MVMQAEPVYLAYEAVCRRTPKKPRVIYLTPQGKVFHQDMAREFALEEDLIFLCGHYEGIDERVLEEIVTDPVSIGDYVLDRRGTAAMVMIDAISRMVPGVLSNEESGETSLLRAISWNIPSTAVRKNGAERKFAGAFVRAITRMWNSGAGTIHSAHREIRPDLLQKADLSVKERRWLAQNLPEAGEN